jgi:hypothetical protein
MKKSDVMKKNPHYGTEIANLERQKPYIISWHGCDMIIQITHFHKRGIVFKPLSTVRGFRFTERSGRIDYESIPRHNFRPATLHDINLNMGTGTKFMSSYFGDVKTFTRNHGHEIFK